MKKFLLFKKHKIVLVIGCCLLVLLIAYFTISKNRSYLYLKDKIDDVFEYGEPISLKATDYLNFDSLDSKDRKLVNDNVVIKSNAKNEDGKEYPKVGKYKVTITYKKEKEVVDVQIKDTVKPEIIVPETIEIIQGIDLSTYDFKSLFKVNDLSEIIDYNIDLGTIDSNLLGEYNAKVSVIDASKNKSEKDFKIIIIALPSDDKEVIQEVVDNGDGTTSVKAVSKKKDISHNDASPNSSNSASNNQSSNNTNSNKPDSNTNTSQNNSGSNQSNNNSQAGNTGTNTDSSSDNNQSSSSENNKPSPKYISVSWSYKIGDRSFNDSWAGPESRWSSSIIYLPNGAYDFSGPKIKEITYEEYKHLMGY